MPQLRFVRLPARTALVTMTLAFLASPAFGQDWTSKVDPWVLETTEGDQATEVLIVLAEQADLSGARFLPTKEQKGRFVFKRLRGVATRTQGPVLDRLSDLGIEHRPYWITNMIWARADRDAVAALAARDDVARISANPSVRIDEPEVEVVGSLFGSARSIVSAASAAATPSTDSRGPILDTVEANIAHVGAPDFWAAGFTGQGVVVAGQDSGYEWDHPALINQYRGWNGSSANHNYHWHDAVHSGGGSCGPNSQQPCDDHNHGTATLGLMVGDDGLGNQIGMAPGARWIGCRSLDEGAGTPARFAECFQFFLAPTNLAGLIPRPDLAPDVINNSWGCPPFAGCTDPNVLRSTVETLRAAGIVVVASAGNQGSACSTITAPPAIYDATISVGFVNNSDNIASLSSRGPVTSDGSNRLKPDVVAPGVLVRTTVRGGVFQSLWTGSSLAAPHVAGQVALLISSAECLRGNVDAIEAQILGSVVARTSTQQCGGISGSAVPNPIYGHGAIRAVIPAPSVCSAGPDVFSDGFETGTTSAWSSTVVN